MRIPDLPMPLANGHYLAFYFCQGAGFVDCVCHKVSDMDKCVSTHFAASYFAKAASEAVSLPVSMRDFDHIGIDADKLQVFESLRCRLFASAIDDKLVVFCESFAVTGNFYSAP